MKMSLRAGLLVAAGLAMSASSVMAADLPCNTARVIVPWGAGGESDILGRVAVEAANRLGAKPQLQVVTISGQGGIKGTKAAIAAKPDGCTLFNIHQHVAASHLSGRLKESWDAFKPVVRLTRTVSIIGAGTDAPFNDYKEMQTWAKANPNKLLAGGTLGSTSHFSLLQVQDALGITMKIVSYDGTADRMKAMLANTIHIGQVSEATAAKNVQTGNLKVLAVNANKRSPILTETMTSYEQGFKIDIATDRGFMAPKDTPDDVIKHWADIFDKVAHDPAYIAKVEGIGSVVDHMGPADYTKWWQATMDEWTAIAKRLGVYRAASK